MFNTKVFFTNTQRIIATYNQENGKISDTFIIRKNTSEKNIMTTEEINNIWQLVKAEKQKGKTCIMQQ